MEMLYIIIGVLGVLSILFSVKFYSCTRKRISDYSSKQMELYGKIIDNMPFPVMLKDVNDDLKYIYWNKQCDKLSGYNRHDVLGKTDLDIYGKDKGELLRNRDLKIIIDGKQYINQEQFITPDKVIHDTVVHKVILENEFNKWLLTVRWDITDFATVQRSLALANNQLNLAFASGNITPWIWDIQGDKLFFGIDRGLNSESNVVTPRFIIDHTHPEDKHIVVASLNELRVGTVEKANFIVRFDFDLKFDKYYNIFSTIESLGENGNANRIIGFMQDITASKIHEKELIVANEKIEQVNKTNDIILNNTDIGLVFLTPDYVVQWENLSKYIGGPIAQVYKVGEHCYSNVKKTGFLCADCVVRKAFSSKQREEKEIIIEDIILHIVASPVFDAEDNCQGIVLKVKDITEDRRRENDLREAKERAEKSDKLKSSFLANMSHEIRTPLNAILGFSELLSVENDHDTKQEYIKIINNNNDLLLHLINDILDLSKIEANTLEFVFTDVNITDMMLDLECSFKFKVSSNSDLDIIFEKSIDEKFIYTDRHRIQQVISNFLINALKFTDHGSITFGCELRGDDIYFYVTDTGVGIPKNKLDDIFKRFTKLNNFKTGTGLGLTICQTIIQKLNGEIGVVSELGKGSTFWFTIPFIFCKSDCSSNSDKPNKEEFIEAPVITKKIEQTTILIAEDTIDNYKLYEAFLGKKYNLLHAWDGIEAVNMFKENNPTIIFMDIKMPEMNGYEATAAIREINKVIPIIAVTAFVSDADKKQISESGFTGFLAKPIQSKDMFEMLNKFKTDYEYLKNSAI